MENYCVADLGAQINEPFKSVPIKGLVGKPTPKEVQSNLAVLGRYILSFVVLGLLGTTVVGLGDEIQLTDVLDEPSKVEGLKAVETDAGVFDCGNKRSFLNANLAVSMRDPEARLTVKALIEKSG